MSYNALFKGIRALTGLAILKGSQQTTPARPSSSKSRIPVPAKPPTRNSNNTPHAANNSRASATSKQESSILQHVERLRACRARQAATSASAPRPSRIVKNVESLQASRASQAPTSASFRLHSLAIPSTGPRASQAQETLRKASDSSSTSTTSSVNSSARVQRSLAQHVERISKARDSRSTSISSQQSASRRVSPSVASTLAVNPSEVVLSEATKKLEVIGATKSSMSSRQSSFSSTRSLSPVPASLSIRRTRAERQASSSSTRSITPQLQPAGLSIKKGAANPGQSSCTSIRITTPVFVPAALSIKKSTSSSSRSNSSELVPASLSFAKSSTIRQASPPSLSPPEPAASSIEEECVDLDQAIASLAELVMSPPAVQLRSCLRSSRSDNRKRVQWKDYRDDGILVHEFKAFVPGEAQFFSGLDEVNLLCPVYHPHQPLPGDPRVPSEDYAQLEDGCTEWRLTYEETEPLRVGTGHLDCGLHGDHPCCQFCRDIANDGLVPTQWEPHPDDQRIVLAHLCAARHFPSS
ncbi:hypothetical protein BP6252_02349 [Coleophoma cylindrospora]|uniref:Uncharacterized protein n=1 Tax=Coleophoma cylindrospora TaxID=1849047 RepID=A0A3D8SEK9_9HELO|nr:hypothetical protein BP6252_02349 [Coleophoma cylindrospora]